MSLDNLKPAKDSNKNSGKRVGRGQGTGKGGTSTRGHKGAKSRSGYSKKIGFEGGQMPLQRRVPKFGFKNLNKIEYRVINLDILQDLLNINKLNKEVTFKNFVDLNLARKKDLVKVLGRGKIDKPIKVHAHKFSDSAKKAIESIGGECIKIDT